MKTKEDLVTFPKPPKMIPEDGSRWVGKYCAKSKEERYATTVKEVVVHRYVVEEYIVHFTQVDGGKNPDGTPFVSGIPLKDFKKIFRKID